MSTYINMMGGGQGGEGEGFGAYACSFLASPLLCSKAISDMSGPLYLHKTEVIPTHHNTLHVESVSIARGRLSKLIDELEPGTWLS